MHTKTARARGKVRAQYRWAYATSTLQENGQNQHEKGGWAFNTSWAYNTYSTVHPDGCASTRIHRANHRTGRNFLRIGAQTIPASQVEDQSY